MAEGFVAEYEPSWTHTAVRVRDLERMMEFYHGLIGLAVNRIQGPEERPEIVWLRGVQLIRDTDRAEGAASGSLDHVGIGVSNIEAICARLEEAGAEVDTPLERRSRPTGDLLLAFYRDPEGNRVELLKYL